MPGHGLITTEYTIWCSKCELWVSDAEVRTKAEMARKYKRDGWKKAKGKWVCSDCVTGKTLPNSVLQEFDNEIKNKKMR